MSKETLYQKIYSDIVEGIKTGQYPPGSRVPSEKELANIYKVSRITSKKALELMEEKNLITRMVGRGSYVLEGAKVEEEQAKESEDKSQWKTIGVIMDAFGASFGYQLLLGIEKECSKHNLGFVLKCTFGSKKAEVQAIDDLLRIGVSGIIIMCVHDETYNEEVLKLIVRNYPIVLIDRQLKGIPIPYVGTNNYSASKELTEWLFIHGHTNICFTTHASMQTPTILERKSGFIDCHLERNIVTNESMWITNLRSMLPSDIDRLDTSEENDLNLIRDYIKGNPNVTAFFAVEYSIGILVYRALKMLELEKEKTVVFFDGIDELYDPLPIFTRVKQDEYQIGVNSVRMIVDKMNGKTGAEVRLIPYKIIEGKSL